MHNSRSPRIGGFNFPQQRIPSSLCINPAYLRGSLLAYLNVYCTEESVLDVAIMILNPEPIMLGRSAES